MTLIVPQTVSLRWNATIKKRYVELGYQYTKMGEYFEVDILHLQKGSNTKIKYICDYCTETIDTQYIAYNNSINDSFTKKDCCKDCTHIKVQETNMIVYGGKSAMSSKVTQEKKNETMMKKYGTTNMMDVPEVKLKQQETLLRNYNVSSPMHSEEIKDRKKKTDLERYGFEYSSQNNQVKQKSMDTHMERYGGMGMGSDIIAHKITNTIIDKYGVDSSLLIEGVTEKRKEALGRMSKEPLSKQQNFIHSVIGGTLNYPLGAYLLDIALVEEKIAIEFDGGGHDLSVKMGKITPEQFQTREKKRANFLKLNGWKTIRVVSFSDKLPEKEELKEILHDSIKEINETKYLTVIKLKIENREDLKLYKVSV